MYMQPTNAQPIQPREEPCPICGGVGFYTNDVPYGDPEFGKLIPCACKADERRQQRLNRLREIGRMTAYAAMTFSSFQIDYSRLHPDEYDLIKVFRDMPDDRRAALLESQRAQITTAAELCYRFAQGERERLWILLKGSYGTGKTHLAAAAANLSIERGQPALFITVPDLLDHLRAAFGPSSEISLDTEFEQVKNAELLILDDLGAENPSAWAVEKLYQLLGYRHVNQLPTIITTNNNPDLLDPRIRSRLLDHSLTQVLNIDVPDMRSPSQSFSEMDLTRLDRHLSKTFESFDLRADENIEAADLKRLETTFKRVKVFARKPERWLLLLGEPGTGKTHLAAASALELNARGERTLFVTTSDLVEHLRIAYGPMSQLRHEQRIDEIRNAPVLVLDDLRLRSETDARGASNWIRERLHDILLYRYDRELPTLITTSLALNEMDGRLRSRFTNADVCTVDAITVPAYGGRAAKRRTTARRG